MSEAWEIFWVLYGMATFIQLFVGMYFILESDTYKMHHIGKAMFLTCYLWPIWLIVYTVIQVTIAVEYARGKRH